MKIEKLNYYKSDPMYSSRDTVNYSAKYQEKNHKFCRTSKKFVENKISDFCKQTVNKNENVAKLTFLSCQNFKISCPK